MVFVQELRQGGGQAFVRQPFDQEHHGPARREGPYFVADFDQLARLGVNVVDAHVARFAGGLRQRARLENARGRQPTIDAGLVGDGAHGPSELKHVLARRQQIRAL